MQWQQIMNVHRRILPTLTDESVVDQSDKAIPKLDHHPSCYSLLSQISRFCLELWRAEGPYLAESTHYPPQGTADLR